MRGLGYIVDDHDPRDRPFELLGLSTAIPKAASLKQHVVDICDQLGTNSCVLNAWCQALRIADRVAGRATTTLTSRLFGYYAARKLGGGPIVDLGTQIRLGAQAIIKLGCPPETAWPFDERRVDDQPSWEAFREAYDRRGPAGYVRVTGVEQIKQAIAAGKPVVGGTQVGKSLFGYRGGIFDPDQNEEKVGGHALCFTGYTPDYLEIVNSYGPLYGEKGFMRVSNRWAATFRDTWAVQD